MIEIIQWTTLAICCLVAAARVPSALRGENRSLFYIFALVTFAILLSIEAPYVAIDRALGGFNLANLLLRFVIFAALLLLGVRVARGFGATGAYRLITGPVGMLVLLAISALQILAFLLMDTAGSAVGMTALGDDGPQDRLMVELYATAGRAYPAYVCLVLLPAMVRAARTRLPFAVRVAAGLLAGGGAAVALTLLFPVLPPELGAVRFIVNYTAVLCFVAALAMIWGARVSHAKSLRGKASFTEK